MSGESLIEHVGTVHGSVGTTVYVKITSQAACSQCQARGACGTLSSHDEKEKIIEIEDVEREYKIGDPVKVIITQGLGFKALFLGYLLPFILLMATLLITKGIGCSDGLSGLLSIAILFPYYGTLYLYRENLKRTFRFILRPA